MSTECDVACREKYVYARLKELSVSVDKASAFAGVLNKRLEPVLNLGPRFEPSKREKTVECPLADDISAIIDTMADVNNALDAILSSLEI